MITIIIEKCKKKILSVHDVYTFYLIMHSFNKYAPSTFKPNINEFFKNCSFIHNNINNNISNVNFPLSKIFQIKLLFQSVIYYHKVDDME